MLKRLSNTLAKTYGRTWDTLQNKFLNWSDRLPVGVAAYRGFGRRDYVYLSGRVLRDKAIGRQDHDSSFRNLVNNLKRFNSKEIGGAELTITLDEHQFAVTTDSEGYFVIDNPLSPPLPSLDGADNWRPINIKVNSIPGEDVDVNVYAEVMIPETPPFGLISDIDDTILKTDVTSLLKLRTLYLTLLKNAGSRLAFRQVSAFYRALHKGLSGTEVNPCFYVSNSPWNLYDLLDEFIALNDFPRGPILLRDFGLPYRDVPGEYRGHKYEQVKRILSVYPSTSFILIGDSGEKDTDIYLSIAQHFPNRIKAIYIRDVLHLKNARRVAALIERAQGVPVKMVRTYEDAARHAADLGLLDMESFQKLADK